MCDEKKLHKTPPFYAAFLFDNVCDKSYFKVCHKIKHTLL